MKFPPHLKYLHDAEITWFNPCWGYLGFWKRIKEFQKERGIDFNAAWLHRDMKRNKELYVTALAALCMQHDTSESEGWWFTKTRQDPPDGIIGTPQKDFDTGGNLMSIREVEIVEYLDGPLTQTIDRKLRGKLYEPNTILICLLSPRGMGIYDFQDVSRQVSSMNYAIKHIFVVFHGFLISETTPNLTDAELAQEMSRIAFIQLAPKYGVVNILPSESCAKFISGDESAWLKFEGRGRRAGFKNVTVESAPKLFD